MEQLTEHDLRRLLDPSRVIAAIEAGFRDRYPSTVMPIRTQMNLSGGLFLIMPCYDAVGHALGMKLVFVKEKAQEKARGRHRKDQTSTIGLPAEGSVQATYFLLDPETARPRLIMPANYLTELRTAATSAVATKFLARPDARTLGIFGTGRQARAHLKVLPLVRNFERVLVCGKDPAQSREFAEMTKTEGVTSQARLFEATTSEKMTHKASTTATAKACLPIEPANARTVAAASDVICTCTISPTPLFDGAVLRPGTHLNLVGAFQPHAREVDSVTVQRSRVVVDTYDTALTEAGDLLIPMKEGTITREHILADLHELVSAAKLVRRDPADITLFKSVGCALEDLVTAELVDGLLRP